MSDYLNTFTSENYQCNYFDVESFNSKHSNNKNKHQYLKICHINIRSLNLSKHTLYAYLESLNCTFDIILITECENAKKQNIYQTCSLNSRAGISTAAGSKISWRKTLFKL